MLRFRPVLAVLLALALTVGTYTMAVARGQAASAGSMVICSGYGIVSIEVDAQGNPVGPVHPCPDCLAGMMAFILPDAAPGPSLPLSRAERLAGPSPILAATGMLTPPNARGPPVMV